MFGALAEKSLKICVDLSIKTGRRITTEKKERGKISLRDIEHQRGYYDQRWSSKPYANPLDLQRAVAILSGLAKLGVRYPKILDLGCGTGWLSSILGRFGPTTGIDLSAAAIRAAQNLYPDVRFLAEDIFGMQEITEPYDVVVSQEVIEHVEDQAGYIDLAAQLLRPGGHLLLTTPNARNFLHWRQEDLEAWGLQPIEQWLTTRQLRLLLERRFRILHLRTFICGYGTEGIFRIANSPKLLVFLKSLGLATPYTKVLERAGLGLHIFAIGERL